MVNGFIRRHLTLKEAIGGIAASAESESSWLVGWRAEWKDRNFDS